jgi:hypothetical protein
MVSVVLTVFFLYRIAGKAPNHKFCGFFSIRKEKGALVKAP